MRYALFSIAIGIILSLCICCCCRCCGRRNQNQQTHLAVVGYRRGATVYNIENASIETKDVEWKYEKEVNYRLFDPIVWSYQSDRDKPLKITGQACSICLEENTTCELFCGHQYHPICIGDWLKKSSGCPCCRR